MLNSLQHSLVICTALQTHKKINNACKTVLHEYLSQITVISLRTNDNYPLHNMQKKQCSCDRC